MFLVLVVAMDENNKSVDRSVSSESDRREARCIFHTPLGTPQRTVRDDNYFRTPFDSPLKTEPDMPVSQVSLTIHPSPVMSSDSGSEGRPSSSWLLPVPPSRGSSGSSKLLLSESPANVKESPPPARPKLPDEFAIFEGKKVENKPDESKEDLMDCNLSFTVDDVEPGSPQHVLKKFTLSPEFLMLKVFLSTDENENDTKFQDNPCFQQPPRKDSLNTSQAKQDLDLPRKSSLSSLDTKHPVDFKDIFRTWKPFDIVAEPLTDEKENSKDDVNFKNMNISKAPTSDEMEEPWSLKNLQIVEPPPIADNSFPLPFDLPKLCKPSAHLGNLLESCKNSRKFKKSLDAIPFRRLGSPESSSFATASPKTKRRNFCCIHQPSDPEVVPPPESDFEQSKTPLCGFSSDSENEKKRGKKKHSDRNSSKKTKSSSTEKQKHHRPDQNYCDLLKQQHEEIQKQRLKAPQKKAERVCRSDPPDKSLVDSNPVLYDFNVRSEAGEPAAGTFFDFESEPYSKRPQEKPKLDRIESFYENKKPLQRIESLYENQKPEEESEGTAYRTPVVLNSNYYPKEKQPVAYSSWWPVEELPPSWGWMPPPIPPPEVGFHLRDVCVGDFVSRIIDSTAWLPLAG